jgi:hypothetical protein
MNFYVCAELSERRSAWASPSSRAREQRIVRRHRREGRAERKTAMNFGIGIATSSDSWKLAQRAEELGFTHAWFFDTQMITGDCFVAMAAAALKTSRIRTMED